MNGSDVRVLRSGRGRLLRPRTGQNRQIQSETSTTTTSDGEDEDNAVGFNQKQQRGRVRGRGRRRSLTSESESNDEDYDRVVQRGLRRSERNKKLLGHTSQGDDSEDQDRAVERGSRRSERNKKLLGHTSQGDDSEDQDRAVERGSRRSERNKKLLGHTSQGDDSEDQDRAVERGSRRSERNKKLLGHASQGDDSEDQDRAVERGSRRSERNKKLLGHASQGDDSEDQDRAVERGSRRSERNKKLGHTSQGDDSEDQDRAVERGSRRSERNKTLLGHTSQGDDSEDQDRAVERGSRRSERNKKLLGHTSKEDDSDSRRIVTDSGNSRTERVQRSVSTRCSEPPPTPSGVGSTARRDIADVSVYATPPRMSRRLALKRHESISNVGLSLSNFPRSKPQLALTKIEVRKGTHTWSSSEAKQVKRRVLTMETVSNEECPPLTYQLRQRVKSGSTGGMNTRSSSRDSGVSETEGTKAMMVRITARKRRKVSTSPSTGSSSSSENKLNVRQRQGKPRRKRHIPFYESSNSSSERSDDGCHEGSSAQQQTKLQAQLPEIKNHNVPSQKSRRKQATPRKLRQKLVHFSQTSDTQSGSEPDSNAGLLSRLRSRTTRVRQGSSDTDSGSSDDSEYEPRQRSTPRSKSRMRRHGQPPSTRSAVTSGHRVVDLADGLGEQTQPGSQWEYVAVQTVAASDRTQPSHSPQKVSRERFMRHRRRASETESDYGHVSVVSSEEVALITGQKGRPRRRHDGDKLCRVSESSSSPVSPQPALQSIHNLRKRAL